MTILRDFTLKDAEQLAENISNKKVLDNLRDGLPYPYTVKDAEEFIKIILKMNKDKENVFAIMSGDILAGAISYTRQPNIHFRTAEIGYYIGEPFWRKGLATASIIELSSYLFKNTDIIRLYAEPFSDNIGSCKALEKAGFSLEGILRKNAVKNGKIVDMKMYSLINSKTI